MADIFFEPEQTTEEQVVDKIKLGDEEFTQEELSRLVGLGKIGDEAEKKYHTKIDRIWPQFQSIQSEKKQLEDKIKLEEEARAKYQPQQTQPSNEKRELTPEEVRQAALEQAEKLGIGPQAIRQQIMELMQGQQLINDIGNVIDTYTAEGLPEATTDDILKHMQETGIRNPDKAYKDLFEKEWIAKQAEKLNSIKPNGMPTITQSNAGSKQPAPLKVTGDNFDELFAAALEGH